ncbi:MAG: ATP-binding protein [bacterium]
MLIEKELVLQNKISELATLADELEQFAAQADISMSAQLQLNLALDELFTNIVNYAYDDTVDERTAQPLSHEPSTPQTASSSTVPPTIEVRLQYDAPTFVAWLIDWGRAFDPTAIAQADTESDIETRQIGGLGIHFVRRLMDDMTYQRINGQNQLRLEKKLD